MGPTPQRQVSIHTLQETLGLPSPPRFFSELWRPRGTEFEPTGVKQVLKQISQDEALADKRATIISGETGHMSCKGKSSLVSISDFMAPEKYPSNSRMQTILIALELGDDGTIIKRSLSRAALTLGGQDELEVASRRHIVDPEVILLSQGIDDKNRIFYRSIPGYGLHNPPPQNKLEGLFVLKDGLVVPARDSGIWSA